MAKAKQVYQPEETPASSQKANTVINDYLARGQLIVSSTGNSHHAVTDPGGTQLLSTGAASWITLGWYPYNPAKQIYDRMDIIFNLHVSGTATDVHLQYSLDSEASWTSANPGQSVFPLGIRLTPIITDGSSLGPSVRTVDISGIAATGYIGLRIFFDVAQEAISWHATAFLYLNTDNPF